MHCSFDNINTRQAKLSFTWDSFLEPIIGIILLLCVDSMFCCLIQFKATCAVLHPISLATLLTWAIIYTLGKLSFDRLFDQFTAEDMDFTIKPKQDEMVINKHTEQAYS